MKPLYRYLQFDRTQINEGDRTIPIAFSSEQPVDRGDYDEVLDHNPEGMDLTRLKDSHPVLLNHNPDNQIGVVDSAELSADKKGRAIIRFGNGSLATEIFNDVKSGIRKHISVGYERLKTISSTKDEAGRNTIRFAWRPFEVSVVPVPADTSVGVGRGKDGSRTMALEQCACLCRIALTACNDALGEIEDCDSEGDAVHAKAAELCRDSIACLAITAEDVNFWSEATAADCVEVCAECAAMCDQAVITLRAIGACPNCGSEANDAIGELEQAAECCRENAGIDPANPAAAAEGEVEAQTGVETRAKVDGQHLPNANAKANQPPKAFMADPVIPPVVDPKIVEAERTALRTTTVEGERKRATGIRTACERLCELHPEGVEKFRALAADALGKDTTTDDFNAQLLAAIPGVRKATMITAESLGMGQRDINQYSLVRAIQSVLKSRATAPDGLEGEVHKAMETRMRGFGAAKGGGAEGFWVPHDICLPVPAPRGRRDLTVTTFGQGGAFVQTTILTPIIEIFRNRMVANRLGVQSMAGLEGNVAIPRQTGAATAYTLPETATLTLSTQAIDQVLLAPHRVGALGRYSKQLLLQSSVDVENFMRDDLMKVLAIKWDKLILEGSGAGSEPTGVLNTTGIGSVTFGATATLAKIVAFETALALANADQGTMAYITTPSVRAALKVTPKVGSTFPIFIWEAGEFGDGSNDGEVNSYRAACTNQIANNAVAFGSWGDAIHALWGGYDVVVDPFTGADGATVRIIINTFGDVAVRHAASFAWSSDAGNQ